MLRIDSRCFQNDICQSCINRAIKKYGSFQCDCSGITIEDDVALAIKEGSDEFQARFMFDPCFFFENTYGHKPRKYQRQLLCCTSRKLVARFSRQTGKTICSVGRALFFVITNANVSVLFVTPQEAQIKKIFQEYILKDFVYKSPILQEAMISKTMSPYYEIIFSNQSKVTLMLGGPGVRGQSHDQLFIDEAAIISKDILADILMVIASRGDQASLLMTSTPKSRNDNFYKACEESPEFSEMHISIYDVDEMRDQVEFYKKLLSPDAFKQECLAEWLPTAGGPFNLFGVKASQSDYYYELQTPMQGWIFTIGTDWNGPNIGSYFYVIGFNSDTGKIRIFDKKVVASTEWNSLVAKQALIDLNRKWKPKHLMVDEGFSYTICEDLKLYSIKGEQEGKFEKGSPDAMIKHILEPVAFGSWIEIDDPFSHETLKKSTKSFIISQVSRLFEPIDNRVSIEISKYDKELIDYLENLKLLNTTSKGVDQYGFEKGSGIEDHVGDSMCLAIYGIIKHYGELFKKIVTGTVILDRDKILSPNIDVDESLYIHHGQSIILLTDNSPEPIRLDSRCSAKYEPKEESAISTIVSRTFDRELNRKPMNFRRNNYTIKRSYFGE